MNRSIRFVTKYSSWRQRAGAVGTRGLMRRIIIWLGDVRSSDFDMIGESRWYGCNSPASCGG